MRKISILIILLIAGNTARISAQVDSVDYKTSPFQMTIFTPPFSTNGMDNANYVNQFSLNLFVGLSGGVDGMELGGFINVDRYFMHGFQGAGFGNTVGGNVDGFQVAGFYNAVGGDVRYVQGAGFINATGGNQTGLQTRQLITFNHSKMIHL